MLFTMSSPFYVQLDLEPSYPSGAAFDWRGHCIQETGSALLSSIPHWSLAVTQWELVKQSLRSKSFQVFFKIIPLQFPETFIIGPFTSWRWVGFILIIRLMEIDTPSVTTIRAIVKVRVYWTELCAEHFGYVCGMRWQWWRMLCTSGTCDNS